VLWSLILNSGGLVLAVAFGSWHRNADSWRIKARSLRLALLHVGTKGQERGDTRTRKVCHEILEASCMTRDKAVDIMIYTLGGISIALALATGVGLLFFSF